MNTTTSSQELLTPREAAALARRTTQTLLRWANAGKLHPVMTPAGTRRYHRAEVEALLNGGPS